MVPVVAPQGHLVARRRVRVEGVAGDAGSGQLVGAGVDAGVRVVDDADVVVAVAPELEQPQGGRLPVDAVAGARLADEAGVGDAFRIAGPRGVPEDELARGGVDLEAAVVGQRRAPRIGEDLHRVVRVLVQPVEAPGDAAAGVDVVVVDEEHVRSSL